MIWDITIPWALVSGLMEICYVACIIERIAQTHQKFPFLCKTTLCQNVCDIAYWCCKGEFDLILFFIQYIHLLRSIDENHYFLHNALT